MTRLALLLALALAVALVGCGRKGDIKVPKGAEAEYNYPAFYPSAEGTPDGTADPEGEEQRLRDTKSTLDRQPNEDDYSRSSTTIY